MPSTDRLRSALADRYSTERELGSGGMATVYLARDLKQDRESQISVGSVMLRILTGLAGALTFIPGGTAAQQPPPLLPEPVIAALAGELSGERAHATIVAIARHHRTRGSRPLHAALELIVRQAAAGGLDSARIAEFPADGRIFYGTQRSRPPWDAEFAELWEMRREGSEWTQRVMLASWETQPMSLAQDSESGDATAELIDVGAGTAESDYAGKDVRGKLILTSAQPGAVVRLAVERFGAAGIVSYAQNQRTAWWGENPDLVRWGHLNSFDSVKTFAFMLSPRVATAYRDRLSRGERITLRAKVRAGQRTGAYAIGTAMIRGADPQLSREEIVFSCHIDHPSPGANDNASGCAAILEAGVTLAELINDRRIPRPARSIRFVWAPEIEGTLTILNARPEWASRIRAVVHMDMVGGGPDSKAVFHVSSGPASLPSFVYDVAQTFGKFVNDQTYSHAASGSASFPLVAKSGGREPLRAELDEFDMGSDHQIYSEGSWRIPAIYLHDWPDRYIHTTWDTPDRIDPTKLKRAAFIGAASGYFLAAMSAGDTVEAKRAVDAGALRRAARVHERLTGISTEEAANFRRFWREYDSAVERSIWHTARAGRLTREAGAPARAVRRARSPGDAALVFVRVGPAGPMTGFGYDYLTDKLGAEGTAKLRLLSYSGLRGSGADYAYEVLNLVAPSRTALEIRDDVSAIYGPVPLEIVVQYLRALEQTGVLRQAPLAEWERSQIHANGSSTAASHCASARSLF